MASFSMRYRAGESEELWNELRALSARQPLYFEDGWDVSLETMRRVRHNV